jgi:hypothetical protein
VTGEHVLDADAVLPRTRISNNDTHAARHDGNARVLGSELLSGVLKNLPRFGDVYSCI